MAGTLVSQAAQCSTPPAPEPVAHGSLHGELASPGYWRGAAKAWSVAPLAACLSPRSHGGFGILTYHRVSRPLNAGRVPLNVTPEQFRRQLSGLLAQGYEPLSLRQALARHLEHRPLPRRAFAVAFDDGYACVLHQALPILDELQVPATVFLTTAYLDRGEPFPFDRWGQGCQPRFADAWRPLATSEAETLLDSNWVELGSHTHTHQDFRGRTADLKADVEQSVEVLRRRFGIVRPALALPFGTFEAGWADVLRTTGVCCCLTGSCHLIMPGQDPYAWGRFGAEQYDGVLTLRAKLDGWYTWGQRLWRRLRYGRRARPRVPDGTPYAAWQERPQSLAVGESARVRS